MWKVEGSVGAGTFGYVVCARNYFFKGGIEVAVKIPRGDSHLEEEEKIWEILKIADPELT
jgi:hypothetical protein